MYDYNKIPINVIQRLKKKCKKNNVNSEIGIDEIKTELLDRMISIFK
jgi:hypothetical protein